jgi:hypothetical protein
MDQLGAELDLRQGRNTPHHRARQQQCISQFCPLLAGLTSCTRKVDDVENGCPTP